MLYKHFFVTICTISEKDELPIPIRLFSRKKSLIVMEERSKPTFFVKIHFLIPKCKGSGSSILDFSLNETFFVGSLNRHFHLEFEFKCTIYSTYPRSGIVFAFPPPPPPSSSAIEVSNICCPLRLLHHS